MKEKEKKKVKNYILVTGRGLALKAGDPAEDKDENEDEDGDEDEDEDEDEVNSEIEVG